MTESNFMPVGEKRYKDLEGKRRFYLEAAKDCCRYTLPCLLTFFEESSYSWGDIETPYQAIGARGVNNLASKLLTAITPINVPMFRLSIEDDILRQAREGADEKWATEIQTALTRYADAVLNAIKTSGDYAHMYEVWQLLLISGNVLIVDPEDNGNIRVYSLRDYVLKRDRSGNVIEIVLREMISRQALGGEVLATIETALPSEDVIPSEKTNNEQYELYTYVVRDNDKYNVHQECKGVVLNGTQGVYPLDGCPFIPIRMYAGAGEDYSRSYVSNYLGDLKSVDGLSQGAVEGAAMAAKHIYMVRPDGLTDIKDIEDTANGGVIYGKADDVNVLQSNKAYDLRVVSEEAGKIERRLAQAFLLLDGGIRDAERVTREEIKAIASELEAALGGVYSVMCYSFQTPYIKRKIWKLQKLGMIARLDKAISPVVVTGFEALGMNGDKERLLEFVQTAGAVLGEAIQKYIDPQIFIKQLAASMGINTSGLIKSEEALAFELQQAQAGSVMEGVMNKALPSVIGNAEGVVNAIGGMIPQKG